MEKVRYYKKDDVILFRKTKEKFGSLSNMASGFPVTINGVKIRTIEHLYQASRFPYDILIQEKIIKERSPMTAKMISKPYRNKTRENWINIRIRIMRWCLKVKLIQNYEKFSLILLSTDNKLIVENSRKDKFWGAIEQNDGILKGENILGRLLVELREEIRNNKIQMSSVVSSPNVEDFFLFGKAIREIKNLENLNEHNLFYY